MGRTAVSYSVTKIVTFPITEKNAGANCCFTLYLVAFIFVVFCCFSFISVEVYCVLMVFVYLCSVKVSDLVESIDNKPMNTDALAVANYFVEIAKREDQTIQLLGLVKRVYIAHGFSLALRDKPLLDHRFDRVEAWRYGPVIPSVYHSFKHHGRKPITEPSTIARWSTEEEDLVFSTPKLEDEVDKQICEMVWKRYVGYTGSDMVTLTHREGTPWALCYVQGENCTIPDRYTKQFYKEVVRLELETHERRD